MTRTRWIKATWDLSFKEIAKCLSSELYLNGSDEGFSIDRIRNDTIEGRYIKKLDFIEIVRDPFGKETEFKRFSFEEQKFIIKEGNPGLQLQNGTRGTNSFFSLLSRATDFKFTVQPIRVDVEEWLLSYYRIAPSNLTLKAIQIGNLVFPDGSTAKMVIKSEKEDVSLSLKEIVNDRPYTVEKIYLSNKEHKNKKTVLISSNASITTKGFSANEEKFIIEAMEKSLSKILK